jgi:hypothetical protein
MTTFCRQDQLEDNITLLVLKLLSIYFDKLRSRMYVNMSTSLHLKCERTSTLTHANTTPLEFQFPMLTAETVRYNIWILVWLWQELLWRVFLAFAYYFESHHAIVVLWFTISFNIVDIFILHVLSAPLAPWVTLRLGGDTPVTLSQVLPGFTNWKYTYYRSKWGTIWGNITDIGIKCWDGPWPN